MMKIYVLRHGITGEAETDKERQLTDKGVAEVEAIVSRHREEVASTKQIICSPMPRVRATVDIAARILNYDGPITESDDLTTGCRLNEIVSCMQGINTSAGDLLLSSHQSCTSILVLWLIGEDILIPNGSLLAIELHKMAYGAGKILWQDSSSGEEIKRAVNFTDQF